MYGLSPRKILFTTGSEVNDQDPAAIERDRRFFCSELIAKALKVLEMIHEPEKKSSASYMPGSFAYGCAIDKNLKENVALGPELNVLAYGRLDYSSHAVLDDMTKRNSMPSSTDFMIGPLHNQHQNVLVKIQQEKHQSCFY